MSSNLLRASAERHRLVASTLSDPRDRAIINQFADEVENLGRLEVAAPLTDHRYGDPRRRELAFLFAKIYRPEPSLAFEELIQALEPRKRELAHAQAASGPPERCRVGTICHKK